MRIGHHIEICLARARPAARVGACIAETPATHGTGPGATSATPSWSCGSGWRLRIALLCRRLRHQINGRAKRKREHHE